jgi:hypothetical protein
MADEWKTLADIANGLTALGAVLIGAYLLVSGKVHTSQHTEDVVKGKDERIADLLGERDRATEREEMARRELAENNAVLARLEGTVREALGQLARRR